MSGDNQPHRLPLEDVPEALHEELRVACDHYLEQPGVDASAPWPQGLSAATVARVWASSRFVARWCVQHPDAWHELAAGGWLSAQAPEQPVSERLRAALADCEDDTAVMRALRVLRNREMVRIAWRDIAGEAPLEATLEDLSALADGCIDAALAWAHEVLAQKHGQPRSRDGEPQQLVVVGMGKLGGRELNFSSDIDLILAFPEAGETDGERCLDNEVFFTRVGRKLVSLLNERTADGFVFRVDTRLRPFGDSGPLVLSFAGMEAYYETHGRAWERYALIKARPVAGDLEQGEVLMTLLRPFVYRRYLDYGSIESLRELKQMIEREVRRKGLEHNIKLGSGGIREVEFVGQVFQLIRGGHDRGMQIRRIIPVIQRLGERGLLAPHMVQHLDAAYRFLRVVENRLQQLDDQQVHELPDDPVEQTRLAYAAGCKSWDELSRQLRVHRQHVSQEFSQVFESPQTEEDNGEDQDLLALWEQSLDASRALEVLTGTGMAAPEEALRRLQALHDSGMYRNLTETARSRLARLMPLLIGAAGATRWPDRALERLLGIIEAVARRSNYLMLLAENPMALSQLSRLVAASPWIAAQIARYPVLLDELLDARTLYHPPDRDTLTAELDEQLANCEDLEEQMDMLRRFRGASVLRVAAADIVGNMPLMRVSDYLTEIAEVIVERALVLAWQQVSERYGEPYCRDGDELRPARFAIIGYGKLGGLELGYGSDLDLVFLHDSRGEAQMTRGAREVDNAVFFARLAQRLAHLLSTPTAAGVVYETDLRLRPSGDAGMLVNSVEAFRDYQLQKAWTWEHQALVRGRVVGGDRHIAEAFAEVRAEVLAQTRDTASLRREVREMRERMRTNLDRSTEALFDLKQGAGGIADIEFVVQYGVLAWAKDYPAVLEVTDNIRLLEAFASHDLLPRDDCAFLIRAYRAYRARVHECSLQEAPEQVPVAEMDDFREGVSRIWRELLEAD